MSELIRQCSDTRLYSTCSGARKSDRFAAMWLLSQGRPTRRPCMEAAFMECRKRRCPNCKCSTHSWKAESPEAHGRPRTSSGPFLALLYRQTADLSRQIMRQLKIFASDSALPRKAPRAAFSANDDEDALLRESAYQTWRLERKASYFRGTLEQAALDEKPMTSSVMLALS